MTQEERQLLLQDLSARLPYGVIVQYRGHNTIIKNKVLTGSDLDCNMEYYKPYLRSMSSMTEEERKEHNLHRLSKWSTYSEYCANIINWLLKNHFDYCGLIEKGLAIKVTEKNNPYKG